MNLKHISDKVLLNDTKRIAGEERLLSSQLLHHLREVERRKLFSDLGYSSLYAYLIKELKYTEASASRSVQASRLLEQIPEIESKIIDGSLSLSNITKVATFFKDEDITDKESKREILAKIENTSARECEVILFSLGETTPLPKERTKVIFEDMLAFTINITKKTLETFTEAKNLSSFNTNDEFLNSISSAALERLKNKKFHCTNTRETTSSNPRYVTANIKKEVHAAAKGKCQKCGTKMYLQYDHVTPYSLGGKTESNNLRLLCFSCNQRARIRARL